MNGILHDIGGIIAEITDDWVETFKKPENQNGFMWRMAACGVLPQGVDIYDGRVVKLCKQAAAEILEAKGEEG